MFKSFYPYLFLLVAGLSACKSQSADTPAQQRPDTISHTLSDDSLLTLVQEQTFQYFWEGAEPTSGLARERIHMDGDYPQNDEQVITTGGSGFGIMGIIVAMERDFISKDQGQQRLAKIVDYLGDIPRFKGAWSHWYHGDSKQVKAFSDKDNGGDLVETAFLTQALIVVREYYKDGTPDQKIIADKADQLWKEVNWNHYTNGGEVLLWHWSPTHEF